MKKYLFLVVMMLIGASNLTVASPKKKAKVTPEAKGGASINLATAEAHINFLASDELDGREADGKADALPVTTSSLACNRWACNRCLKTDMYNRSKLVMLNAKREANAGKYIRIPSLI